MMVKIDSREKDRVKSASKYFKEQGLEVTVEELKIGDYIFTDGHDEVVFEFKTIDDFITSIYDGRVYNETINQIENFNHHFLIIKGTESERAKALAMSKHFQEVTYFQYLGCIASINRYTTVIESYSPFINEAYYRMLIQAKKCLQNKPIVKKFPKKHKNNAFNWLCYCNYGISSKKATAIIKTLNLQTLDDLQKLTIDQLTSVPGIGETIAQKIMDGLK